MNDEKRWERMPKKHDPFCPKLWPSPEQCECWTIAKVRKDEEKQWLRAVADGMVMVRQQERANPRDEYHTMDELYEYRMLYNAAFVNTLADLEYGDLVVKSLWHSDGELCFGGGWFVVVMDLPTGQVTNHYESKYWDLFRIRVVGMAPKWDGHTPAEAAERLRRYCEGGDA